MKDLQFTNIGKEFTKDNEKTVLENVDSLEWQTLPAKDVPLGQGMAIKGVIEEWGIPARRVAMYGMLSNLGLYGIETKLQQIFFVDDGVAVTPIALRDL